MLHARGKLQLRHAAAVFLLALQAFVGPAQAAELHTWPPSLPHVTKCNLCSLCHVDPAAAAATAAAADAAIAGESEADAATIEVLRSRQIKTAAPRGNDSRTWHSNAEGVAARRRTAEAAPVAIAAAAQGSKDDAEDQAQVSVAAGTAGADTSQRSVPYRTPLLSNLFPGRRAAAARTRRPNCTECWGCSAQLQHLNNVDAFGRVFKAEVGGSPEYILRTELPGPLGSGPPRRVVVKVWCLPVDKRTGELKLQLLGKCEKGGEHAGTSVQFLLAQQKMVEECGLLDTTVKVWVAPVNAILPGHGLHIWWHGLWMEEAPGLSLNQLSYVTDRDFVRGTLLDLLQRRLNTSRVVAAATMDLLTSQCDRHAQNVFVAEDGNIRLIDNTQALQFGWKWCSVDSVLLPGTLKNEIARFGGNLVWKLQNAQPRRSLNPTILLDYRCFVPGGTIGKSYHPRLKACLGRLAGMTAEQVQERYGFPYLSNAKVLQTRAAGMHEHGFEWALQQGQPLASPQRRYRWHRPCCEAKVLRPEGVLACAHDWPVNASFPLGEPRAGMYGNSFSPKWERLYPDPGEFVGGTVI